MDTLEQALLRMEESARRLDLLIGESPADPMPDKQDLPVPERRDTVPFSETLGREKGEDPVDIPARREVWKTELAGDSAGNFSMPARLESRLYPPAQGSYQEISTQMLEDMRRRSTLPLDEVRTVVL